MQQIRKQDDFYDAVNAEWQQKAIIPNDKPSTGGFNDLNDAIEKLMLKTTDAWLAGENVPENDILQNFVKYHRLASDWDTRNAQGVAPVKKLIQRYLDLNSFDEYNQQLAEFEKAGLPNALPFGIAPDFKDARTNVLWADSLGTILPDTTYYASDHPQKDTLLAKWREVQTKLFDVFGFSKDDTDDILDKNLAFDERIAAHILSNEAASEMTNLYHPYRWDEFEKMAAPLDVTGLVTAMLGQVPDRVIVSEEAFWQHAALYYSNEAWPMLKAHLVVSMVNAFTGYLTNDIRLLGGEYGRYISGIPEAKSQKKAAYSLAQKAFDQPLGLWYAHTKFSPEAKADVEAMVQTMIDVYKQRLTQVDWLAETTKAKAIVKLNAIKSHIGYPDQLPERYAKKIVKPDDTLVSATLRFVQQSVTEAWARWQQPVDPNEWQMPANLVNAYYDPQQNQIVFPAAILQAPFYDLKQSASENYGGIGAVIAHEISHAFDTNGASFDEFGNLNNWWTKADFEAFKTRTQKVVDQFDGLPIADTQVNGNLTVSENVADLGGLADALQAAKRSNDFNADEFFTNWARVWRESTRPEFEKMMAAVDVHAPNRYRTNIPVSNFDDFYDTYQVESGDGMYRDPKDRVMIW